MPSGGRLFYEIMDFCRPEVDFVHEIMDFCLLEADFFKKLSSHIVDKNQLPFHTAKAVIQLTHHLLHIIRIAVVLLDVQEGGRGEVCGPED